MSSQVWRPSRDPRRSPVIKRPGSQNSNVRQSQSSEQNTSRSTASRRSSTRTQESSSQTKQSQQSYLDDPECIQLREENWKEDRISEIEPEKLQPFYMHLIEYSRDQAENENYQNAKHAARLKEAVLERMQNNPVQSRSAQGEDEDSMQKIENDYNEKKKDIVNTYHNKQHAMYERQQKEREEFDRKWTEEIPDKYRKPSQRLVNLKLYEKNLAKIGDYDGAEQAHAQVLDLMKKEQETAQIFLVKEYKINLEKLEIRHAREEDDLESWYVNSTKALESQHEIEKLHAANRSNVLSAKRYEITHRPMSRQSCQVYVPRSKFSHSAQNTLLPPLIPPTDKRLRSTSKIQRPQTKQQKTRQQDNESARSVKEENAIAEIPSEENSRKKSSSEDSSSDVDSVKKDKSSQAQSARSNQVSSNNQKNKYSSTSSSKSSAQSSTLSSSRTEKKEEEQNIEGKPDQIKDEETEEADDSAQASESFQEKIDSDGKSDNDDKNDKSDNDDSDKEEAAQSEDLKDEDVPKEGGLQEMIIAASGNLLDEDEDKK